jgi:hypothetical protein
MRRRHQVAVTIHANWLNGNKMKEETMKHYGYWISLSADKLGVCKSIPKMY